MREQTIIEEVKRSLKLPDAYVKKLGVAGGMTNLNYVMQIDGDRFIVRIPGNGTESFINRDIEYYNLQLGSELGINPPLVYFNQNNGMKITREIMNALPLKNIEQIDEVLLEKAAVIFQKLHYSSEKMPHSFNLFSLIAYYKESVEQENMKFYDGYSEVELMIKQLENVYNSMLIEQTSCHIDPAPSNFLVDDDERMYLIDWEYGGLFDPLWDIAAFGLEAGLSPAEEKAFQRFYFQRRLSENEQQRVLMHKIFQDFLWSLWTLYKENEGDHFGLYGVHRFGRAKENLQLYRSKYMEEGDVAQ